MGPAPNQHAPIALAITGASGAPYWMRLLEVLLAEGHEVHLVASANASTVSMAETGLDLDAAIARAAKGARGTLRIFDRHDFMAPMASGSARLAAMVICPCSTGTLARIAHGTSSDLVTRAADVCLKERRKLIVVPRETPLSLIHLRNMVTLTEAGAVVLPAMPGFYNKPEEIADLVDFVVQRITDQLGLDLQLSERWGQ
ncbi:aromatic acid decarboxylase [bacterium]|nr:MAG: aromatic acid decarboxylase [bacterium]